MNDGRTEAPETLVAAVERATAEVTAERDAAAVALARLYARQIDQAAAIRAQADRALRKAAGAGDETLVEEVAALRAKVTEIGVLDRIGARLHALLVELHGTPKARGKAEPPAPTGGGALGKLRVAR